MVKKTKVLRSWGSATGAYADKRIASFLFLGFASGLPWLLVYTVLSNWLRQANIDRTTIGLISWVGFAYAFKFVWSPVVDRANLPLLHRLLGRRRSWMALALFIATIGLIGMAFTGPQTVFQLCAGVDGKTVQELLKDSGCGAAVNIYLGQYDLTAMILFSILTAFASATFDIALDAYRIEIAEADLQGSATGMYIGGYRIALAGGSALALLLSDVSWQISYLIMAVLLLSGFIVTTIIREPKTPAMPAAQTITEWVSSAVTMPFIDFFQRYGLWALIILLFMAFYKFSDIVMATMAQPLYVDLGFEQATIAGVTKAYGLVMTILGTMAGGVIVARYGALRPLWLGVILVALPNVLYAVLASSGADIGMLTIAISADNFGSGFAAAILVAYLSSMTSTLYTATQYALFSSFMTLPGKFLGGFSGWLVDTIGYEQFFLVSAALGIPGLLLAFLLIIRQQKVLSVRPA